MYKYKDMNETKLMIQTKKTGYMLKDQGMLVN